MRLIIFSIFLFNINPSFSQICDTTETGDLVNCIDSDGLKQGKWIEYDTKLMFCGDPKGKLFISGIGEYENGKKIGVWRRYDGPKYNSGLTSTIEYHPNGIIEQSWVSWIAGLRKRMIWQGDSILLLEKDAFDYYYFKKPSKEYAFELKIDTSLMENFKVIEIKFSDSTFSFYHQGKKFVEERYDDMRRFEFEIDRLELGCYEGAIKRNMITAPNIR
ncbi:hypothetical protein HZR84_09870 [Hyphobacterium sp. CCMP332]|nr:hypothetical protein HZR84_09870 [Hyphobacterium sp. CCMP332]